MKIKVKPKLAWVAVDKDGYIYAVRGTREAAQKFARGWSNEIADTSDIFGWRGGFTLCGFPTLYVRRAMIAT